MVTIKIQSAEDIAAAYLKQAGFDDRALERGLPRIVQLLSEKQKSGDEIIEYLDKKLLQAAEKIFPDMPDGKAAAVARVKAVYMLIDGPARWGTEIFMPDRISSEMAGALRENPFRQTPASSFQAMKPQPIVPSAAASLFSKILHPFRKSK